MFTSSSESGQLLIAANARSTLTETNLDTGEKVSKLSIPFSYVYPLATKRALQRSTVPSVMYYLMFFKVKNLEKRKT